MPVAPLVAATFGVAAVLLVLAARLPGAARASRPVAAALVLVGAGGLAWGASELLRYAWGRDHLIGDVPSYLGQYAPPVAGVLMYLVLGLAVVVGLARAGRAAEWAGGVVVLWGATTTVSLVAAVANRSSNWLEWQGGLVETYLVLGGALLPAAALVLGAWAAAPPAGLDDVRERWRGAATAAAALFAVTAIGLAGTALVVDEIVPELAAWSWARSAAYWFAAAALGLAAVRWERAPLLAGAGAVLGATAVVLGWLPDDGVVTRGGWIVAEVVTAVVVPAAVAAGAWWTGAAAGPAGPHTGLSSAGL